MLINKFGTNTFYSEEDSPNEDSQASGRDPRTSSFNNPVPEGLGPIPNNSSASSTVEDGTDNGLSPISNNTPDCLDRVEEGTNSGLDLDQISNSSGNNTVGVGLSALDMNAGIHPDLILDKKARFQLILFKDLFELRMY